MEQGRKYGFAPVYDRDSKVLILGSFPSVKSREIAFYYGNKQNRFWKMICGYFGESIPKSVEEKKTFLLEKRIALWDMAISCEIEGSADADVKNVELIDLDVVLNASDVRLILLNGTLAYQLFMQKYANIPIAYKKMPSTSPANPRYDESIWGDALDGVFQK